LALHLCPLATEDVVVPRESFLRIEAGEMHVMEAWILGILNEYCGRYGGTTLPSVRAPSITRWFACGGRSSAILTVPSSFTQWTVTGTV
jgi:hypothetical protein